MKTVNPKIDLVFKKIFGTDENKDLLKSLINSILPENEKITTLTIKNPYNDADFIGDKLSIVDIKATDEKDQWYNIEIQIREQGFFGRRSLYYWSELYSGQLFEAENFDKLNKTVVINLLDFDYFTDKRYVRRCSFKDFDTNELYSQLDYADIYFVELTKFDNELKHIKNTLDRWIVFLNKASEYDKGKIPEELAEDEEIVKAVETVKKMYLNAKEREYYEGRKKLLRDDEGVIMFREAKAKKEGIAKGRKEGMEKGMEKGRKEGMEKVAKGLKAKNIPVEIVIETTGLTKEDIEKL